MKFFTIGSGAWGLALSNVLSENGHHVFVYARNNELINEINEFHKASKYLSDVNLHSNLVATNDFNLINESDFVLIAVPSKSIKDVVLKTNETLNKKTDFINATKGLEPSSNKRIQEYLIENLKPEVLNYLASILGPGFAYEVCKHNLTCLNSISFNLDYAKKVQKIFSNAYFRVYVSDDVIGAEFASSIKNAIAIASGIIKGLGYNENSKAALITRGLAEMARFGINEGAKKDTFFGLTGVGDLVLTCNSTESRNYSFGYKVGKEKDVKKIVESNTQTIEGLYTIKVIYDLAKLKKIDTPIIDALYDIFYIYKDIEKVVNDLMLRPLKSEKI